jgi:hypothetical protein
MIYLWLKWEKKMEQYKHLKIDDLADAYFLSQIVWFFELIFYI